jgi:hypothetical protein
LRMKDLIEKNSLLAAGVLWSARGVKSMWIKRKHFLRKYGYVLLSLIATPFIIFISTSIELYLNNRIDLDNKTIVLLPFLIISVAMFVVGCLLYRYRQTHKFIKLALSVYYALGPIFIIYTILRKLPLNSAASIVILVALLIAGALIIYRNADFRRVAKVFAWLTLFLIISQAFTAANKLEVFGSEKGNNISVDGGTDKQASDVGEKTNIYHILLDEYQTDMFDLTLTDDIKKQMGGFTYYPETTTVYGRTGMSLPTIFTGNSYDYVQPQIDYEKQAFSTDKSFLYWLKDSGYDTTAFIHKVYTFDLPLFDKVVEHNQNSIQYEEAEISDQTYIKLFTNLWLHANAPKFINDKFVSAEFTSQIAAQNVLTDAAPVHSQASFKNITNDTDLLDKPKSYIFAHLLFPHFPYVMRSDCTYDEGTDSSPKEQSECATKLVVEFLNKLKELDRYDDSLIIIQSDHGARFKVENNDLVSIKQDFYSEEWSNARSRSLLMIKAPGNQSNAAFEVSNAKTTLLDIAPTLLDYLGIDTGMQYEGRSLVDNNDLFSDRVRYYHFFDKIGKNDLTDKLHRYIIEDGGVRRDKTIPLSN